MKGYVTRASQPDYADYFVQRINGRILAEVPAVRDDPLLVEDLDASTRAHWLGFLETVTQPELTLVFPDRQPISPGPSRDEATNSASCSRCTGRGTSRCGSTSPR